eukprot:g2838.t1
MSTIISSTDFPSAERIRSMSRRDMQKYCKEIGVRANAKNIVMRQSLLKYVNTNNNNNNEAENTKPIMNPLKKIEQENDENMEHVATTSCGKVNTCGEKEDDEKSGEAFVSSASEKKEEALLDITNQEDTKHGETDVCVSVPSSSAETTIHVTNGGEDSSSKAAEEVGEEDDELSNHSKDNDVSYVDSVFGEDVDEDTAQVLPSMAATPAPVTRVRHNLTNMESRPPVTPGLFARIPAYESVVPNEENAHGTMRADTTSSPPGLCRSEEVPSLEVVTATPGPTSTESAGDAKSPVTKRTPIGRENCVDSLVESFGELSFAATEEGERVVQCLLSGRVVPAKISEVMKHLDSTPYLNAKKRLEEHALEIEDEYVVISNEPFNKAVQGRTRTASGNIVPFEGKRRIFGTPQRAESKKYSVHWTMDDYE